MIIKMIMSNAATHTDTMLKVKIAVSFPVPVKVLQYQYEYGSEYFNATFAVSLSINVK